MVGLTEEKKSCVLKFLSSNVDAALVTFVVFCFECKFVASAAVHFRVKRTAPNLEWNSQCKMSYIFKI